MADGVQDARERRVDWCFTAVKPCVESEMGDEGVKTPRARRSCSGRVMFSSFSGFGSA